MHSLCKGFANWKTKNLRTQDLEHLCLFTVFSDVICGMQNTLTRLVSPLRYAIVSITSKFIKDSGNTLWETGCE